MTLLRKADVEAGLTSVAAGVALIAVVDHELDPVRVSGLKAELVEAPARLASVALALDGRGCRVGARAESPVVLGRVGAGLDARARLRRGLPRSEHVARRDGTDVVRLLLPVARPAGRIARGVGDERCRELGAAGRIGRRRVAPNLGWGVVRPGDRYRRDERVDS